MKKWAYTCTIQIVWTYLAKGKIYYPKSAILKIVKQ